MKRSGPLRRVTPLKRKRRLRKVSAKRDAMRDRHAEIREVVFARDGGCLLRFSNPAAWGRCAGPLTPHHLQKASQGGAYSTENLVALCACHNSMIEDRPGLAVQCGFSVTRYVDHDEARRRRFAYLDRRHPR